LLLFLLIPEKMKALLSSKSSLVLLLGALLAVTSCGDPKKQASRDLKQRGYELSAKDFILAAGSGDLDSLELFARSGLEVDVTDEAGNTALIRAASSGHREVVERLLGMGADPRHLNREGRDALIVASAKGFEEIARLLLSRGSDFNLRDAEGWSALTIAAYNGHEDVVSLLSTSVLSTALDEALLVASFSGDTRVIGALLSQGADINSRSPEGKTPLMIASEAGKLSAVRVLLQSHANPYAEVEEGINAGVLAARAGHEEIQQLISDPDSWGSSAETERIVSEKSAAQEALFASEPVEEILGAALPDEVQDLTGGPSPRDAGTADRGGDAVAPGAAGAGAVATLADGADGAPAPGAWGSVPDLAASGEPAAGPAAGDTGTRAAQATAPVAASMPRTAAAGAPSPQLRAQVREEAASKPVVAMNGSTIRSTSPEVAPVRTMVLASFHQEPIPLRVTHVESGRAEVRRLDQPLAPLVEVAPGEIIPGTNYEVLGLERRFVSSKEGKGRMVDVSRVKVHDRDTGATHLLMKDVSGQSADTYAILTAPNSQYRYVVKAGDVFRSAQPGAGERDYQVLDIRPSGVVVKDLATAEVLTIARDGVQ